jgi:hypothetical protein
MARFGAPAPPALPLTSLIRRNFCNQELDGKMHQGVSAVCAFSGRWPLLQSRSKARGLVIYVP